MHSSRLHFIAGKYVEYNIVPMIFYLSKVGEKSPGPMIGLYNFIVPRELRLTDSTVTSWHTCIGYFVKLILD